MRLYARYYTTTDIQLSFQNTFITMSWRRFGIQTEEFVYLNLIHIRFAGWFVVAGFFACFFA